MRGRWDDADMGRRLILIGGSAGSGKTTLAQTLTSELDAGWLQLDTVWIAMKSGCAPRLAGVRPARR